MRPMVRPRRCGGASPNTLELCGAQRDTKRSELRAWASGVSHMACRRLFGLVIVLGLTGCENDLPLGSTESATANLALKMVAPNHSQWPPPLSTVRGTQARERGDLSL